MLAQRLVSFLILLTLFWARAESGFGVLRDGAVHHEGVAAAAVHHELLHLRGDHGHERLSSPSDSHGLPGHSHGSPMDHCTHHHDPGVLTAPVACTDSVRTAPTVPGNPTIPVNQSLQVPTEPPRA